MADPRLAELEAHLRTLADRRASDALLSTWAPTRPQTRFFEADESEVWFLAANRSGKSDALAAAIASHLRFGTPNLLAARDGFRGKPVALWAVSLTNEMSRDILQPKIFDNGRVPPQQPHPPFVPKHEIHDWNKTESALVLKNGSMCIFKSCEQGRDRAQGAGRQGIYFDEAPDYPFYDEATMRVEGGARLFIRGAATLLPPEGLVGGVSWLYSKKIQPYLEAKARGERLKGLELIQASIYENPHILRDEIERLEAKYPPGSKDRRIRLDGEWLPDIGGARAYAAFDRTLHVRADLGPQSVDPTLPLILAVDFNVSPMGGIVCQRLPGAYNRPLWRILDEITIEHAVTADMAEAFKQRFPRHRAELWVHGDATGMRTNQQTGKSDYTILMGCLATLPYPKRLLIPPQNPPVMDRVNAVNSVMRDPVSGQIGFEIAAHCEETIADFEQVLRDGKTGGIKKTSNKADPYSRRTAWSDAFGYAVAWSDPVREAVRGRRPLRRLPEPSYNFGQAPAPRWA